MRARNDLGKEADMSEKCPKCRDCGAPPVDPQPELESWESAGTTFECGGKLDDDGFETREPQACRAYLLAIKDARIAELTEALEVAVGVMEQWTPALTVYIRDARAALAGGAE